MPEQFLLEISDEHGKWWHWAGLRAEWFARDTDGTYVCTSHGGSPIYLRALAIDEDGVIEHVDGDGHGQIHRNRLVPQPGEPLPLPYE